jgi:hypothetical protein
MKKIDGVRERVSDLFEGAFNIAMTANERLLFLALLDEHEKGIQVNMSWDQPEAYDQWYDAHAAVEKLLEEM